MIRNERHTLYGLSAREYSSKGLWLLVLLYLGSLASAVFVSLIAWHIVHYLDPEANGYLANKPYPKYFDRARWLCVLFLLPYLFWQCRITSFKAVGFTKPFASTASKWFIYGFCMILFIYAGTYTLNAIELKPELVLGGFLSNLDNAILAGVLIGLFEEIVFRGLVFRMFYTALKPIPAIIASSVFFAILHFKASSTSLESVPPIDIGFADGLSIAFETITALVTHFDFTYLAAIFLVGVVLHQAFLITNNLWANVSLHAGWVFTIKGIGGMFQTTEAANLFTGTTRVADGYWVVVVLLAFTAVFSLILKSKPEAPADIKEYT